jgi:hypothetical protein
MKITIGPTWQWEALLVFAVCFALSYLSNVVARFVP